MLNTTKIALCLPLIVALSLYATLPTSCAGQELNTALMNSTFEIFGPSSARPGETTFGTVFFLGKPLPTAPDRSYFVMITAAHVLDEISGDVATLNLRRKDATGAFITVPFNIRIRNAGANLYVKGRDADVAAMYQILPQELDLKLIPLAVLADDDRVQELEIHPGEELSCLGFPLGISLQGFPVLRTGTLASYPLVPSRQVQTYVYAFHVFPGNSGGPVYFSFSGRIYGKALRLGDVQAGIIGLVSQQVNSMMPGFEHAQIDLSIIVPSSYIKDTVALLPDKP